ncbi:HNH endonuclease signature motif containing protein [Aeromonas veronii]|uniref:HNH endonuclease signature motif containing protein n=1 Tax=Aeromonas veronii TaxID=654 RepID=UPI00191D1892|nr:HNH endonuclease signature motif containing protein [Aeromonas veronii]MBL0616826.1 HNH endonuclease [Aeromonas veronii]
MTISDKNRKVLWGKSGNKCAICRHVLVLGGNEIDSESVIGEECHIISGAPAGPRSNLAFPRNMIDEVSNLILLCRNHHKQIDSQVETYTLERLREIKSSHERWVEDRLKEYPETSEIRLKRTKEKIPLKLPIMGTGKGLFNLAAGSYGFYIDYSNDFTDEELDLVATFIQNVKDWAEIANELEPIERIDASKSLDKEIRALREMNIFVFAAIETQKIIGGIAGEASFPVLHLSVNKGNDSNVVFE